MSELLDPASEWAGLIFQNLHDLGVKHIVISPGSRSTPFVLAATRTTGLTLHTLIDERSAAFFALGLAKASQTPALLLCTSGSALAHYLPAIVEATYSHTPMLIMSADRPLELQQCGAPQTLDQTKFFGDHVQGFFDLGAAPHTLEAVRATTRMLVQAHHQSLWPTPGPVHLNVQARKPLEPRAAAAHESLANDIVTHKQRPLTQVFRPQAQPSSESLASLGHALRQSKRPLFVAGPQDVSALACREDFYRLATACGAPVIAETTSQWRLGALKPNLIAHGDFLLRSPLKGDLKPDLIVHFGGTPTSDGVQKLYDQHPHLAKHVITPYTWVDPSNSATAIHFAKPSSILPHVELTGLSTNAAWLKTWQQLDQKAQAAAASHLESSGPLHEAQVASGVSQALLPNSTLMIGNSLPVRMIDLVGLHADRSHAVISQRGVNGIDGLLSGAAGVAAKGKPVVLLLGDVSFLHDVGGLRVKPAAPVVVVVVNNGGGRIFEQLPIGSSAGDALQHFTTPHQQHFDLLASAYGASYVSAESIGQLREHIGAKQKQPGLHIVECVVPALSAQDYQQSILAALKP